MANVKSNKNKNNINYSIIDSTIENAILSCYGVSGIAYSEINKKGNADRGIIIKAFGDSSYSIDVYLIIIKGVKITEVLRECQKQLKYVLDNKFGKIFKKINVYAEEIVD